MTASVSVRFGEDGQATVQSYVRLTASTHIQCSTYDDAAPILSIHDGAADITITNPGQGEVTDDDVAFGRQLADAVARSAAELATIAARTRPAATAPDPAGQAA
ncbi:MAG TPA: hypothetical protein VG123_15910 [Streptosporangiaceae bacterium]|nr:hypothetical protein [Streptosporangiaceae bacterium]